MRGIRGAAVVMVTVAVMSSAACGGSPKSKAAAAAASGSGGPSNSGSAPAPGNTGGAPNASPAAAAFDRGKVTLALTGIPASVTSGARSQATLEITNNGPALSQAAVYFAPQWSSPDLQAQVGAGDWKPTSKAAFTPQLVIALPVGKTVIHYRGTLSDTANQNVLDAFVGVPGAEVFAVAERPVSVIKGAGSAVTPAPAPKMKITTTGRSGDFTAVFTNPGTTTLHVTPGLGIGDSALDGTAYVQGNGCWDQLPEFFRPIGMKADGSADIRYDQQLPAFDLAPGASRTIHGKVVTKTAHSGNIDVGLSSGGPHITVPIDTAVPSPLCH